MRLPRLALTLLALLIGTAAASRSAAADPAAIRTKPEPAARAFLYALYANDKADFQSRIIAEPGSEELVGSQSFTAEQLEKLKKEIDALPLRETMPPTFEGQKARSPFPLGTKAIFFTQYRGTNIAIPLQVTTDGWRADVRYWLAMLRLQRVGLQKTDPEVAAKVFLLGVMAKKPEIVKAISATAISGEEYTSANDLPGPDMNHVVMLCQEMPVVRVRPGERLRLPSGELVGATEDPDTLVLSGLLGSAEVPFLVKRIDGKWKVVPQHYFETLRKAGVI